MVEFLIRKLEQFGTLSSGERRVLEALPIDLRQIEADQELVRDGQRLSHCMLLLSGVVCDYRTLQDGGRQILNFHFPGDILDLPSLLLGKLDYSIGSLTSVEVTPVAHVTLLDWTERHPRLGRLLWQDTLMDAAVFREWVVNIGRRSAYARIAHLLCEMAARLHAVGLMHGDTCDLPIASTELADATSLSIVHVSRVLQQLRNKNLVELRGKALVMLDWEGLKQAASFDPAYLHLRAVPPAT